MSGRKGERTPLLVSETDPRTNTNVVEDDVATPLPTISSSSSTSQPRMRLRSNSMASEFSHATNATNASHIAVVEFDDGTDGLSFRPTFQRSTESVEEAFGRPLTAETFSSWWRMFKSRAPYYIPILKWLPAYTRKDLFHDVLAGISVSMMMIPQGLSYCDLVALDPAFGLYACFVPLLVYTVLGTSRQMSVGPEAVVAIIAGSATQSDDPQEHFEEVMVLTMLVGSLSFALGFFRLGFIDNVLSRPLVEGFILGSAFMILSEQMKHLFGYESSVTEDATTIDKFEEFFERVGHSNKETLGFGLCSLAILLITHFLKPHIRWLKFVPMIMIVVIFSSIVSSQTNAKDAGVAVLGEVHSGFYTPRFPAINGDRVNTLISTAGIIVIVGFVEATAISKRYANKHNYMVSANRELVALGAANFFGSIFGSFPVFASLPRSAVNDAAGARTQMHNFVVFCVAALSIGLILPAFKHLPRATMAAIVSMAAISLIHTDQIRYLYRVRGYKDGLLLLIVFAITISLGITTGILVGIALSVLEVISSTALPRLTLLGRITDSDQFAELSPSAPTKAVDGLLIIKIDEPLYFANTGQLKDMLRRIELLGDASAHPSMEPRIPNVKGVIFDVRDMTGVDTSAVQILTEIVTNYKERGIGVCFVRVHDATKTLFLLSGLIELVGIDHLFSDIASAKAFLQDQDVAGSSTYIDIKEAHA